MDGETHCRHNRGKENYHQQQSQHYIAKECPHDGLILALIAWRMGGRRRLKGYATYNPIVAMLPEVELSLCTTVELGFVSGHAFQACRNVSPRESGFSRCFRMEQRISAAAAAAKAALFARPFGAPVKDVLELYS
jgi:hypothetical protein